LSIIFIIFIYKIIYILLFIKLYILAVSAYPYFLKLPYHRINVSVSAYPYPVSVQPRVQAANVAPSGGRQSLTLHALNEFDPKIMGVGWRQKLETQQEVVLATELKNIANKIARWTAKALLAGVEMMKLGYVSRMQTCDHYNHSILTVMGYKPKDFATQINLNNANMWKILKSIVDVCNDLILVPARVLPPPVLPPPLLNYRDSGKEKSLVLDISLGSLFMELCAELQPSLLSFAFILALAASYLAGC
jgi:hypothetical protein